MSSENPKRADDRRAVVQLVRNMLGREPDAGEIKRFVALAKADGLHAVVENIATSREARLRNRVQRPVDTAIAGELAEYLGRPVMIVDIGAQRLADQDHAYQAIADAGIDHRIIGFEPIEERLLDREAAEGRSGLQLLPYFIGAGGEAQFNLANVDATSSLYPFNRDLLQHLHGLDDLRTVASEPVRTTRLDDALADIGAVDFLKLDIQGGELDALSGAEAVLARTGVVHCEVEFAEIYRGQPLFSEIELFLRARNFKLVDVVSQHRSGYLDPPRGPISADRLVWGEAIFFRALDDEGPQDCRKSQALIAELVYRRPGLRRFLTSRENPRPDA